MWAVSRPAGHDEVNEALEGDAGRMPPATGSKERAASHARRRFKRENGGFWRAQFYARTSDLCKGAAATEAKALESRQHYLATLAAHRCGETATRR